MGGKEINRDALITILVVGNFRVGKSSIIRRQYEQDFNPVYFPTEGVSRTMSHCKSYGKIFKLCIWDISGGVLSDPSTLLKTRPFIAAAQGIFFVYDITDQKTFLDVPKWISTIDSICDSNVQKILLGNKLDRGKGRMVDAEVAQSFANLHQMRFFETSASSKTDTNIKSSFCMIIHDVRKAYDFEFAERFEMEEDQKKSRRGSRKRISKCFTFVFPCCRKKCAK